MATEVQSAASNLPELSVTELSRALKRAVEDGFALVRVRGEISGFKRAASGHLYMSLKDTDSVLDAVCWRATAGRLDLVPEDGMEVVCTGRLTTYPGRSKYQIVIERMELAGEGALLKLLEERRKALTAEGLFDAARKRPLPFLPRTIGVVTSPTGAVIRDILHRLNDRFPCHVLLWPVLVQGEGAAAQIAKAIAGFNRIDGTGGVPRPDLLIVARGGGSLEDLFAFNEEIVVRAAAASEIPLISAVGHETDTTLIDFAADFRAPTPTGAAERAVPVRHELIAQTGDLGVRLSGAAHRFLDRFQDRLHGLARGLPRPARIVAEAWQRLDDRTERLQNALLGAQRRADSVLTGLSARLRPEPLMAALGRAQRDLDQSHRTLQRAAARKHTDSAERLAQQVRLLRSLSHESVLQRGFALVRDESHRLVRSAGAAQLGARWQVAFADGTVDVAVAEGGGRAAASSKASGRQTAGRSGDRQGDLF